MLGREGCVPTLRLLDGAVPPYLWAVIVPLVDNFRASGWLSWVRWQGGWRVANPQASKGLGKLGPRMWCARHRGPAQG